LESVGFQSRTVEFELVYTYTGHGVEKWVRERIAKAIQNAQESLEMTADQKIRAMKAKEEAERLKILLQYKEDREQVKIASKTRSLPTGKVKVTYESTAPAPLIPTARIEKEEGESEDEDEESEGENEEEENEGMNEEENESD
jgi:uncharacterized protein YueI